MHFKIIFFLMNNINIGKEALNIFLEADGFYTIAINILQYFFQY